VHGISRHVACHLSFCPFASMFFVDMTRARPYIDSVGDRQYSTSVLDDILFETSIGDLGLMIRGGLYTHEIASIHDNRHDAWEEASSRLYSIHEASIKAQIARNQ